MWVTEAEIKSNRAFLVQNAQYIPLGWAELALCPRRCNWLTMDQYVSAQVVHEFQGRLLDSYLSLKTPIVSAEYDRAMLERLMYPNSQNDVIRQQLQATAMLLNPRMGNGTVRIGDIVNVLKPYLKHYFKEGKHSYHVAFALSARPMVRFSVSLVGDGRCPLASCRTAWYSSGVNLTAAYKAFFRDVNMYSNPQWSPAVIVPGIVVSTLIVVAAALVAVTGFVWKVVGLQLLYVVVLTGCFVIGVLRITYWSLQPLVETSMSHVNADVTIRIGWPPALIDLCDNLVPLILMLTLAVFTFRWIFGLFDYLRNSKDRKLEPIVQIGSWLMVAVVGACSVTALVLAIGGASVTVNGNSENGVASPGWAAGMDVAMVILNALSLALSAFLLVMAAYTLHVILASDTAAAKLKNGAIRMVVVFSVLFLGLGFRFVLLLLQLYASYFLNPVLQYYVGLMAAEMLECGILIALVFMAFRAEHASNLERATISRHGSESMDVPLIIPQQYSI
jgi:hypothetical protein